MMRESNVGRELSTATPLTRPPPSTPHRRSASARCCASAAIGKGSVMTDRHGVVAVTVAWRAGKAEGPARAATPGPCGMQCRKDLAMRETQQRTHALAERYRRFAANEARGSSPLYEHLALHVAGSAGILDFLLSLPAERRQPNLLLAAVRHAVRVPHDGGELERFIRAHRPDIVRVMLSRATQTNEPARCAVMLPLLARLPQPLALIEVGASAGLCLLPDRYGYDYGRRRIAGRPVFPCHASAATPLPDRQPEIVWRAGLDLNPIDLADGNQLAWLRTLVWPEQTERLARLDAAIAVARRDPPRLMRGDLRHAL